MWQYSTIRTFYKDSYARKPTYHQPLMSRKQRLFKFSEQIDKYVMFFILLIIFYIKYADAKILEVSTKWVSAFFLKYNTYLNLNTKIYFLGIEKTTKIDVDILQLSFLVLFMLNNDELHFANVKPKIDHTFALLICNIIQVVLFKRKMLWLLNAYMQLILFCWADWSWPFDWTNPIRKT